MKNTLFLSGLMALCCGAGMAATVAIDLNGEAAEGASLPANLKLSGFGDVNSGNVITAQKVVTWLQGTTGWQGTTANGNSGSGIYGSVTASGDTDVSVSFINRNAYGGSIVGTAVTLTSDYASYTGLTLPWTAPGCNPEQTSRRSISFIRRQKAGRSAS